MLSRIMLNSFKQSNFKRFSQIPQYGVLSHENFKQKTMGFSKPKVLLYEFIEVLFYGTKDQVRDTKIMIEYMLESKKTAYRLQQITRTKNDLLKFIPFSVFLTIPLAEVLLPPYLYFFPNSLPTTYVFDDGLAKNNLKKDRKQMNSQRFLYQHLKRKFPELDHVRDAQEYTPKFIQRWIVDNEAKLSTKLDFKHMNSELLVHVCKFYGMEFVRGTYIIMRIAKLVVNLPVFLYNGFKYITGSPDRKVPKNIKQNWNIKLVFPLEDIKRNVLLFQIRRHLKKIQREDQAFRQYGYDDQTLDTLRNFCRARGLPAIIAKRDEDIDIDVKHAAKTFKRDWIDYCEREQVFSNMKLWYGILYYERYHSSIVKDYEKRTEQLLH